MTNVERPEMIQYQILLKFRNPSLKDEERTKEDVIDAYTIESKY